MESWAPLGDSLLPKLAAQLVRSTRAVNFVGRDEDDRFWILIFEASKVPAHRALHSVQKNFPQDGRAPRGRGPPPRSQRRARGLPRGRLRHGDALLARTRRWTTRSARAGSVALYHAPAERTRLRQAEGSGERLDGDAGQRPRAPLRRSPPSSAFVERWHVRLHRLARDRVDLHGARRPPASRTSASRLAHAAISASGAAPRRVQVAKNIDWTTTGCCCAAPVRFARIRSKGTALRRDRPVEAAPSRRRA